MKMIFFAKVLPERFTLTASEIRYRSTVPEFNLSYEAHLSIHVSQMVIQLTVDDSHPDLETLRNIVELDVRGFVDFYGFLHGVRFDVDMVSVVDDTGNWRVFGIEIPILRANLRGKEDEILKKYLSVAVGRPECKIVMADFREAMRNPPNTGYHCYRAIEAMMQTMKELPTEKNDQTWEKFRNNLNVDRTCLDAIKRHADAPRHGKLHAMTDSDRAYCFERMQVIVLRFLEYLSRDGKPLPDSEFPLVQG
jgi:hypothetical protein